MWVIRVVHKNGLFIRKNNEGLFIFNSYVGLIYAIHKDCSDEILEWLKTTDNPEFLYKRNLSNDKIDLTKDIIGQGWLCDAVIQKNICTLLPSINDWKDNDKTFNFPKKPLMINWLITGKCNFSCSYCYAQDLMHNNVEEPKDFLKIKNIADNILKLNPLVVVLTGGEPTTSPFLKDIIKYLHNKVGIILDTNGSFLSYELATFLKSYDVVVRLSIDSFNTDINSTQRIAVSTFDNIIYTEQALDNCLMSETVVTIQTVVTKNNINTLESMFNTILNKKVKSWRLLKVQTSKYNNKNYLKLVSSEKEYKNIFTKIIKRYKNLLNQDIKLQISENNDSDASSVILVSAEGNFYTEVPFKQQKVKIDINNLSKNINYCAHYKRYLNILWEEC